MIESRPAPPKRRPTVEDPWWIKTVLLVVAISFLIIFLLVPLITVFASAFQNTSRCGDRRACESDFRCLRGVGHRQV